MSTIKKIRISVVILTRNEIEGVKAIIPLLPHREDTEYFAIDYFSKDGTLEYFKKHHIPVIHQTRYGRGEAFKLAATHAKGNYLVFFSPDGNEDPRDIPKLISLLDAGADLAIASRFMAGSRNEENDQLFKFRAWANQGFTMLVNVFWRGHISDSINGYRAIRKDVFQKLHLDADGFAVEFQMTIRALKCDAVISEVPTKEGNRIGGQSTSFPIPTGITFLRYLLRELWLGKSCLPYSK